MQFIQALDIDFMSSKSYFIYLYNIAVLLSFMTNIRELVCIACYRECPRSCGQCGGCGRRRVSPRCPWARTAPRPLSGRPSHSPAPPGPQDPLSVSGAACGEASTGGWAGMSGSAEPRASSVARRDPDHVQNLHTGGDCFHQWSIRHFIEKNAFKKIELSIIINVIFWA